MRLRVKVQGPPSRLERVELPGSAPTLGALHAALEALGLPAPVLSLNKKDQLAGAANTPLRELGVCNGDLLWLLSPAPAPAAATAAAPATQPGLAPCCASKRARGEVDPAGPAGSEHRQQALDQHPQAQQSQALQQQQQQQREDPPAQHPAHIGQPQQQQQQDKGKQAVGGGGELQQRDGVQAEHAQGAQVPEQALEPLPPSQRLPAYLLRTLRASPAAACHSPAGLVLLAAHAAMLETGFLPSWAAGGSGGGGDGSSSSSAYAVPAGAWVSASLCRVEYHLVAPNGGVAGSFDEKTGGAAAGGGGGSEGDGMEVEAEVEVEVEAAEPRGAAQQGRQQLEGEGEGEVGEAEGLQQHQEEAQVAAAQGPACWLQCSSMGGGSVVLAVHTRGHTRHLALNAATFARPLAPAPPSTAAAAAAGPAGSGHGDAEAGTSASTSASAASSSGADATEAVRVLPSGGLAVGGALELGPAAGRDLWRQLKDGLAFPMLLAAYAEAGLQPPAGLLALPEELKQRLLGMLGAQDLAAVCGACSELRHLGSADELWRPLFEREFPRAPAYFRDQARHRGFKWAFGQCWRERRQQEEALRRARARSFIPAVPRFGVPRPPPFYPPPPGPGFPRIIGGDYDRLPQFSGLPGQLGGGSLAPGGLFFSSGRRQGRGGPGGGSFRLS